MSRLTKADSEQFRVLLNTRKAALHQTIHTHLMESDDKTQAELAGRVRDVGEDAVSDLLADLHIAGLTAQVRELTDVEAALDRIAQGVYGVCADCGTDIEPARLRVYITARRCQECQARHENQRRDTSPSL